MAPSIKIAVVAIMLVSLAPFCGASAEGPAVVGAATGIPGVVKDGSPIQRVLQAMLADKYDGMSFSRPDDLIVARGIKAFAAGMAVDNDDRLYVATGSGIEVFSPRGEHLGTIPVRCPPADCQSIAFGGPTKHILYIAGAGSLYKVEMIARGLTTRAK